MKVSIVGGGGEVGSATAFVLAQKDIVDEIGLIDVRQNVAKDHEMDMEQAVCTLTKTRITSGGWERLEGSDIVVLSVGGKTDPKHKERRAKQAGRMTSLKEHLGMITDVAQYIRQYASEAIMINATNPVDVINSMLHRLTSNGANKMIGFSLNDTLRFRWVISRVLDVDVNSVQAMVLGEHGEGQCPISSQIYVAGVKTELTSEQKEKVLQMTHNWIKEKVSLGTGRTSGWLSAINITYLIEAVIKETGEVIPCSVLDEEGVSVGRAVTLNRQGIDRNVNVDMDHKEKKQWQAARDKIAAILEEM